MTNPDAQSSDGDVRERKRVTEVRWDGSAFEIDDVRILKAVPEGDLPEWLTGAAEAGLLQEGHIGYLSLRRGGSLVFGREVPADV